MIGNISTRQQQILSLLLENKTGLSIDQVAKLLSISRNAMQQHFAALERDGFIQKGELCKTAGRPVRHYVLTKAGMDHFPKQYAWFSELLLINLKNEMDSKTFQDYMRKLGNGLSQSLLSRFGGKSTDERIEELLIIMDELGFKARNFTAPETHEKIIEACNCIYHDLAQKHEEICEFDRTLISSLLDKKVEHVESMAKCDGKCRFKIIEA